MFYKKTITKNFTKALQDQEKYFETLLDNTYKKIEQLEKRINNIADYITGPYTKQINENFAQINMQINADKTINKKLLKKGKENPEPTFNI